MADIGWIRKQREEEAFAKLNTQYQIILRKKWFEPHLLVLTKPKNYPSIRTIQEEESTIQVLLYDDTSYMSKPKGRID
jgi:hypothetical protein